MINNNLNYNKQKIILEKLEKLAISEKKSEINYFFPQLDLSKRNQNFFFFFTVKERPKSYYTKNFEIFKYYLMKKPINLLFSLDQFMFEFSKNKNQQKRSSEFQKLLKEQKKITLFYGNLSKKEFQKIVNQAKKYPGYFYRNFFSLIEKRLDVILYRCGFAKTICLARQLITHKKILINNKLTTTPSYNVQPGDCISVRPKYKDSISKNLLSYLNTWLRKRRSSKKTIIYRILKQRLGHSKKKKTKKSYINVNSLISLLLQKINNHISKKNKFILLEKNPFFIGSKNLFFWKKLIHRKQKSNQNKQISGTLKKYETKNNHIYPILISNLVSLMRSQKLFKPFLISVFKKQIFEKRFSYHKFMNFERNNRFLKFGGLKPLHLETSYRVLKTIYLYSPQRIKFPFSINIDLLTRAFR
jgi:ribosomal protein S4